MKLAPLLLRNLYCRMCYWNVQRTIYEWRISGSPATTHPV